MSPTSKKSSVDLESLGADTLDNATAVALNKIEAESSPSNLKEAGSFAAEDSKDIPVLDQTNKSSSNWNQQLLPSNAAETSKQVPFYGAEGSASFLSAAQMTPMSAPTFQMSSAYHNNYPSAHHQAYLNALDQAYVQPMHGYSNADEGSSYEAAFRTQHQVNEHQYMAAQSYSYTHDYHNPNGGGHDEETYKFQLQ